MQGALLKKGHLYKSLYIGEGVREWESEGWCRSRLIYSLHIYLYIARYLLRSRLSQRWILLCTERLRHIFCIFRILSHSSHSGGLRILRILSHSLHSGGLRILSHFSHSIAFFAFWGTSHSIAFYRILCILGDIAYFAFYRILRILGDIAYFTFYRILRILWDFAYFAYLVVWVIRILRILREVYCYALTSHMSLGESGVSTFA